MTDEETCSTTTLCHVRRIGQTIFGLTKLSAVIALALPAVPITVYVIGRIVDSLPKEAHRDLARDVIAFARALQDKMGSSESHCNDCLRHGYSYMLRHEVWNAAITDAEKSSTERLLLCPACVSKRLRRPLTIDDFDPKFGINWPIFCAFQIAGGEPDFSELEKLFDQAEECSVAEHIRGHPIRPDTQTPEAQAAGEEGSPP